MSSNDERSLFIVGALFYVVGLGPREHISSI